MLALSGSSGKGHSTARALKTHMRKRLFPGTAKQARGEKNPKLKSWQGKCNTLAHFMCLVKVGWGG